MKKRYSVMIITLCLLLAACSGGTQSPPADTAGPDDSAGQVITEVVEPEEEQEDMTGAQIPSRIDPNLSAEELVSRMTVGWNLGNTFDATSGAPGSRMTADVTDVETMWLGGAANATTQSLIQAVKSAGFETLRIPVSWAKVADPEDNWKIREDWMLRVKEVVDWALEEDMYVIINSHHDNAGYQLGIDGADSEDHPGRVFLTSIWEQIAGTFIDYDEKLIFESMNEPRHEGGQNEWWGGTKEARDNVNALNQAFVDTVRATGGSNMHRILMVPTHAAGIAPNGFKDFVVPEDPGNSVNKLVLSIHTYSPFDWAHDGKGQYGGEKGITDPLNEVLENAQRYGLPVILGEWGSNHASMGNNPDQELRNEQRPVHAEDYVRASLERGMVPLWWDNGGFTGTEHTWGIIRRNPPHEISELHQEVIDAIMRGAGK